MENIQVVKESKYDHNHWPDRTKIESNQAIKRRTRKIELSSQIVLGALSEEVNYLNYFELI